MKTNVLIIHESMGGGGAERVLVTLLRNIDRTRFNITLLLIYKTGVFLESIPTDFEVLGLYSKMQTMSERVINRFSGLRDSLRERRARRLLAGRKFDTIVSFMEGPAAKLHFQLMDLAPRNLTWVHINLKAGGWYDMWFKKDEEKKFYQTVDKIAFVSADARDVFKTMFRTDASMEVIYNAFDSKDIIAKGGGEAKADDEPFTIINVGRLAEQKRQDRLIRVARILKDRGLKFKINILGTGKLEKELKDLSLQLGTDDCINFLGFNPNPYPLIRQADVFCLTSKTEGYPMVVAESLILNTPVVSTRITGPTEQLAGGGGIFTTEEPEDIADKLQMLMTDPDAYNRLKDEVPQAAKQFRLDTIMAKVSDFIIN